MGVVKLCACQKEFRLPGTEVRVRQVGRGVLLEPIDMPFDVKAWFSKLDGYLDEPFMGTEGSSPHDAAAKNFRRMITLIQCCYCGAT